ncbi:MAG TPA: PQQ-binding-like beta-propeller repeat protein [Polyangiaceae bacterium]|nr:PQQ-binding-like beta-propeller repeat protein [Polyangiaceae bacterium]
MSAIEVVVRPRPETAPSTALAPLHGLFDVIVDGVNITARLGEGQALAVLSDLGHAVSALSRGKRDRITLPLYAEDQPWELGLEADGSEVLVSVYRVGPQPEVAVHERRVDLILLRAAVTRAIDETNLREATAGAATALATARHLLESPWPSYGRRPIERRTATVASRAAGGLVFSVEAAFRCENAESPGRASADLERADLHALLMKGTLAASLRGRSVRSDGVYPFLVAERLVALADELLDAWRGERALVRRVSVDGAYLAVQRGPGDGTLTFTLAPRGAKRDGAGVTLVEIEPPSFVKAVARFARALADKFIELDKSQAKNLRLVALLRAAQELDSAIADATADDSLTNPEPESYRSFGLPRARSERGTWEHGGKMRFLPRWVATVPGIDLRATFHCGERIVVGSQREVACLESTSGQVLWRVPGPRAACVATPLGVARVHQDGLLELIDLERGEARFSTRLRPRATIGAAGALVNAPGLPRLLVLAEGDRSVTAIDLVSGDVRWRYSARRPTNYRLRRAGKLLLAAGGDSALVALDVVTGEVVWRVRDRLPFSGDLCVDKDSAFALAGGPIGPARLFHVDLWSGAVRWMHELDDRPVSGQAPLVASGRVMVPVRDRRGVGVTALFRDNGEAAWRHEPGLTSPMTAWLAVDDTLVANSASGALLSIEAETGCLRFNHVFSSPVDADQPRRLEPVLRNGALFVPQHRVHVVRPRDGEVIGSVPTDLIPDLLRVDERCTVYIAEESGHLAAFAVAPKLELVR